MNPKDPEQYIRDLERGVGQTPGAAPQPFGTDAGSPSDTSFSGQFDDRATGPIVERTLWRRIRAVATLANTPRKRLILGCAVATAFAIVLFLADFSRKTTVHGDLIMINSGAKETIACNDGNLKLDGDNNTYTVTGHCRRLEVFGSANHVTVDSADIMSAVGDDNAMFYHAGSPAINKTGNNNTVAERRAPVE